MSGTTLPSGLIKPSGLMIPRVVDQLSFLYLDYTRISQDRTGVQASMDTAEGTLTTYLPTAALATVLLGPGTSITRDAIITLARHGTSLVFVGAAGVRCYSTISGPSSADLLLELAALVSDPSRRLDAARLLYSKRFPGTVPPGLTLDALRGLEGARMKAIYATHAHKASVQFRRRYTPGTLDNTDPINAALTAGNTALYGICHAVIASLGLHPGLGIIHNGHSQSLTFDIADLYKSEVTIPLAFSLASSRDADREVRTVLRRRLTLLKLIPTIVRDIYELLGRAPSVIGEDPSMNDSAQLNIVNLWNPDGTSSPSGVNHAT